MRSLAAVLLILLLVGSAGTALAQGGQVLASTYRVDLGTLGPGMERRGEILLHNAGYDPVAVRLAHDAGALLDTPLEVSVPPGEPTPFSYLLRIPADAAPGFGSASLRILTAPSAGALGSGTMDAGSAILVTWRVAAVGVSAIEASPSLAPRSPVNGTVLVVNTWNETVDASVDLVWTDAIGTPLGNATLLADALGPSETARIPFSLPAAEGAPGAQRLIARVSAAGSAPVGGPHELAFHMGRESASYQLLGVADLLDGNASVTLRLENTGDVPITLHPTLVVAGGSGEARVVQLAPVTLLPGEVRETFVVVPLPPGRFTVDAEVEGATRVEALEASGAPVGPLELTMVAPGAPTGWAELAEWMRAALPALVLVLGILLLALAARLAWVRRAALVPVLRRARRPSLPPAPAPLPAAPIGDAYDALFAELGDPAPAPLPLPLPLRLPAPARAPASGDVVILLDLEGLALHAGALAAHARITEMLAGRPVAAAYVYARAATPAAAADLGRSLGLLGWTARVAVDADDDLRMQMGHDAGRAAAAGLVVLLAGADGDRPLGRLAAVLREEGAPVELLEGQARQVPVATSIPPSGPRPLA